jgi:hypothetical protein
MRESGIKLPIRNLILQGQKQKLMGMVRRIFCLTSKISTASLRLFLIRLTLRCVVFWGQLRRKMEAGMPRIVMLVCGYGVTVE